MTQLYRSCKGDWILQVERDFHDFKIEFSLSFLEKVPKNKFKDFVSKQAKKYLYMKLYMKKLTHCKMQYLDYEELDIQQYLLRNDISIKSKKLLFKWRVHMENFDGNYSHSRENISCKYCLDHPDTQYDSFYNCKFMETNVELRGNYEDIFEPNFVELPTLMRTIEHISKYKNEDRI